MKTTLTISLATAAVALVAMAGGAQAATHHHKHIKHLKHASRMRIPAVSEATKNSVVSLIKAQAPAHGVPTWFALKIAKVESGYNPGVTGAAGEIGVFQMKCSTAHGIGYSGSCQALYNPATNVQWGLKYLSMAVKSSHGNLALAASKHNGGLGRTSLVHRYVAMVF